MHLKLVLRYSAHATPENLRDPSISVSSDMEIDEDDLRCKFCKKMLKGDDPMYKVGCSKSCPKIMVAHKACGPRRQMSAPDVCITCGQPFKYYSVLLLSIPVPAPDNR